jgi:murein DD-endopeptidase MepM/ murein hydrolase activator NlpD
LGVATQSTNILTSLVASPLQGIEASDLAGIISQPFVLPPAGEDSGHHGVDFAYWNFKSAGAIEGTPVLSIFPGKVASAYSKIRNPYGYMVIVETPLTNLPKEIVDAIKLPEASSTPASASNRLTCPTGFADWWDPNTKSLYVMYAHLGEVPTVKLGQTLKMGDMVGVVGNTGASSSPHLHLEMRIGPANATFASMGHYDTTTTDQERHNYCMWRISGQFEMFDPMELYGATGN